MSTQANNQTTQNTKRTPNAKTLEIILAFQEYFTLKDADIKDALTDCKLPTNVPKKFGGKAKTSNKVEGQPKRNSNAYMFFANENRPKVVKENPDFNPTEVTKKLGEMWGEIKNNKKKSQKYHKLAAQDKDRYLKEMKEFDPNFQVKEERVKRTNAKILYEAENGKGSWKEVTDEVKAEYKAKAKDVNSANGFNGNKSSDDSSSETEQ